MSTLVDAYRSTDALALALVACALLALWCWVASLVTRNYSYVDRLWSIVPVLYTFHFAVHGRVVDARLMVMTTLVVLWGTRLTYNFARKGGYRSGGEDYRWPVLRERLGPVRFQILNATFVAPFQNLLLLLITVPAYRVSDSASRPLGLLDALAAFAFTAFLIGETTADQQQWRFQCDKAARRERGQAPVGDGFLATGLFRYSRHPNFFCEQAMWWCFYLFQVAATGRWLDWSIAGAALLTLLFQGSTTLTEQLTLGKYPAYGDYQKRTSRLLPRPPRS